MTNRYVRATGKAIDRGLLIVPGFLIGYGLGGNTWALILGIVLCIGIIVHIANRGEL